MTITITRQHLRLLLLFAAGALFGLFIFAVTRAEADTTSESTFIPISPCRLFDTRPGIDTIGPRNTPLTAGETHLQDVHGTNGNCTIPTDATAVAMNITAINATNPTFITIWPADTATMPLASILNPTPGAPPTPNKADIRLSSTGQIKIYNLAGTVDLLADVTGYYTNTTITQLANALTALTNRVTALETENAALKTKTASMSLQSVDGQPVVRFTGVNLQLVDGTGDTYGTPNGTGNLIVGYNANYYAYSRAGSHNIVIGDDHGYSRNGALIAGHSDQALNDSVSITGGKANTASNY